jgi:hypothetical protein
MALGFFDCVIASFLRSLLALLYWRMYKVMSVQMFVQCLQTYYIA